MPGIKVFSVDNDAVINALYLTGATTYGYAIENLIPLIKRLDIQRKIQNTKFYERLQKDIVGGCIMPPLTLAFVNDNAANIQTFTQAASFITDNIREGFVLDGIQRLNTLSLAYEKHGNRLNLAGKLFINVVICNKMDNLLYRMITLNNGQKPMTARHQIEILTSNIYNFSNTGITIQSEKDRGEKIIRGSFDQADFVKGYLAFLSTSTNIENQKIIEEKMDELIASKILDSNPPEQHVQFTDVVSLISRLMRDEKLDRWLRVGNNFIGFCVGVKKSLTILQNTDIKTISDGIELFEKAFSSFDISKIKLGKMRRNLVRYYVEHFEVLSAYDELELIDTLSEVE